MTRIEALVSFTQDSLLRVTGVAQIGKPLLNAGELVDGIDGT